MKTVLLGIQARSTSTRLPNKSNMQIGRSSVLQWVVESARRAANFVSNDKGLKAAVNLAILVPKGDPIATMYRNEAQIIEGDENDVLSRFVTAQAFFKADYICRVTADCVQLPAHHITKHIRAALIQERDYSTNVIFRTHPEGWDCEVLSSRLLAWLDKNAVEPADREHVTTLIGPGRAFPFTYIDGKPSIMHIMSLFDYSDQKTSIDTKEEFEETRRRHMDFQRKKAEAKKNGTMMV